MAGDQLVGGLGVAMLAPALGEHEFLLRLQQRELADLLQVAAEVAFRRQGRRQGGKVGGGSTHGLPLSW